MPEVISRPAAPRAQSPIALLQAHARRTKRSITVAVHRPLRRMWLTMGTSVILALTMAACTTAVPNQPDFQQGMWDGETLVPPAGLLTAYQGDLIGRRVDNTAGPTPLAIAATIVDPVQAQPRYVILSGAPSAAVVIVPVNALTIGPTTARITATDYTLATLPQFPTLAALEHHYPRTVITAVAPPPAPAPVVGMLPPVSPAPAPGPIIPGAPLQFARFGSVVGMAVIDSAGTPMGQVSAVAIVPATGEVRFAIVTGPAFGPGYYVAVPATQAQMNAGQVVVSGTETQWLQAPRYRGDQLSLAVGAVGVL
ncbi:MAG TPA: PRC-barrel domain-containing protein [Magnetospirillaceae bacterium]